MDDSSYSRILTLSQELASDLLKRRWPNRYIGKAIIGYAKCVDGLVEMGALDSEVVGLSTKKMALIHWCLSRIEAKQRKSSVTNDAFYRSAAWRKLRFSVILQSNRTCAACGAKASDGARLHVDHIQPRSKYPELSLDPSNLQVLCEDCNIGKSDGEFMY